MKTAKFGGSSLATAEQVAKVIEIIRADPERRCIVVSAPGKSIPVDPKVTDMLISLAGPLCETKRREFDTAIIARYQNIMNSLGLHILFADWFANALATLRMLYPNLRKDYLASRGEYWMARIMAELLDYKFVDATEFISLNDAGLLDIPKTVTRANLIALANIAEHRGVVIPGFYGKSVEDGIKTFSRGGSDITGAIVALCTSSALYENWTDVSGVFMADPRVVEHPRKIEELTFQELRELTYMGASVLHEEAIFPVRINNIPINVRNTNAPNDEGTLISCNIGSHRRIPGSLIGIAGKKGFSVVMVEKACMNSEIGFLRLICQIFEEHNISIEHIPGGIDTLSVIVANNEFRPVRKSVLERITSICNPHLITVEEMALICVAISDMVETTGVAARICQALSNANINIRMINQGASAISIIIGVSEDDYENGVRAIYKNFTS